MFQLSRTALNLVLTDAFKKLNDTEYCNALEGISEIMEADRRNAKIGQFPTSAKIDYSYWLADLLEHVIPQVMNRATGKSHSIHAHNIVADLLLGIDPRDFTASLVLEIACYFEDLHLEFEGVSGHWSSLHTDDNCEWRYHTIKRFVGLAEEYREALKRVREGVPIRTQINEIDLNEANAELLSAILEDFYEGLHPEEIE